jgi:hypothetical protein
MPSTVAPSIRSSIHHADANSERACAAQWDARRVKLKSSYHRANVELGKLATNGWQRRLADSCRATIWMRTASVSPCFSLSRGWATGPDVAFDRVRRGGEATHGTSEFYRMRERMP